MKSIYDEYKEKLVKGLHNENVDYATTAQTIDDLEQMYEDEVGLEKLKELQRFYGLDE